MPTTPQSPSPMIPETPASEVAPTGPATSAPQVQDAGSSAAEAADPLDQALQTPSRWVVVSDDPRGGEHAKMRIPVKLALRIGAMELPSMKRRDFLAHFIDEARGHLALGCEQAVAYFDPERNLYTTRPCGAVPAIRDEVEDELLCACHAAQRAERIGPEGQVSL